VQLRLSFWRRIFPSIKFQYDGGKNFACIFFFFFAVPIINGITHVNFIHRIFISHHILKKNVCQRWLILLDCNQCLSPLKLWVRISFMARCIRYNIMWFCLSVTCDRLVVFSIIEKYTIEINSDRILHDHMMFLKYLHDLKSSTTFFKGL
jgi:hypothetical protein